MVIPAAAFCVALAPPRTPPGKVSLELNGAQLCSWGSEVEAAWNAVSNGSRPRVAGARAGGVHAVAGLGRTLRVRDKFTGPSVCGSVKNYVNHVAERKS